MTLGLTLWTKMGTAPTHVSSCDHLNSDLALLLTIGLQSPCDPPGLSWNYRSAHHQLGLVPRPFSFAQGVLELGLISVGIAIVK
jgi:hypothetical protein